MPQLSPWAPRAREVRTRREARKGYLTWTAPPFGRSALRLQPNYIDRAAAAAVTLAAELPPGAEAGQFRETAWLTATELQLTWLFRAR